MGKVFRVNSGTAVRPDHSERVLDNVRKVLVDAGLVNESRKLPHEAAVVVTKSDLFRGRFRNDNPFAVWDHPPDYRKGFDAVETVPGRYSIKKTS